jgi:DNA polymerase V
MVIGCWLLVFRQKIKTLYILMKIAPPIPFEKRTAVRIPLFTATVEAGFPSPADDHLERSVDLNEELIRNKESTYCVRVQGESMRDAGIHAGDVLVVDRSITPSDKQIVVAMLDGDFTVKRFRKYGEKVLLEPANANFPTIQIGENQEFMIWGVVTYIIHKAV